MFNFLREGPSKNKERNLTETISFNYRGDILVDQLGLKNLKASSLNKKNKDTRIVNQSGAVMDISAFLAETLAELLVKNNVHEYKKYSLTDLGTNGNVSILDIVDKFDFPSLVAVDIFNQLPPSSLGYIKEIENEKHRNLPVLGLKIDMLELMKQLPDNSSNISLFAIDNDVIPVDSKTYREQLLDHIYRVVPDDGIIISANSILESDNVNPKRQWESVLSKDQPGSYTLFRKKRNG